MSLAEIQRGGSPIGVSSTPTATGGSGPVERLSHAIPVLPCPGCVHAPVCAIKPLLAPEKFALRSPSTPHEAVRVRVVVELSCKHFMAGPEAPDQEPGTSTGGGVVTREVKAYKRSAETREKMRQSQLARAARLRELREAAK